MEFLYLFDLLKFDTEGNVCGTSECNEGTAKANFLYLLSKYNQKFLDKNEKVPDFFKVDLSEILKDVENGGDFEKAKALILKNCKKIVVEADKNTRTDYALVLKLNNELISRESEFANEFQKAINNIQLAYIITSISGKIFEEILTIQKSGDLSAKDKSKMFKRVIEYNCLIKTAALVKENKISKESLCKQPQMEDCFVFLKNFAVNA